MLEMLRIKQECAIDDQTFRQITSVYDNIRTKISIIEGCCEYYDPSKGFHCTEQMKKQQPVINLISLVSCAKAIVDDIAEIIRLVFLKDFGSKINAWRLTYEKIAKQYSTCPLVDLVAKYGLNDPMANTFYAKVRNLRNILLHRNFENTYSSGSAHFLIRSSHTHNDCELCAHEYAKSVHELIFSILQDINTCLLTHGSRSIKGLN